MAILGTRPARPGGRPEVFGAAGAQPSLARERVEFQFDSVWEELLGPPTSCGASIARATTARVASDYFLIRVER